MNFFKSFLIVVSVFSFALNAKYHVITNKRKYHDFINQYQFTVLCFVNSTPEDRFFLEKKEHKREVQSFKKALKAASQTGYYKKLLTKEVGFLLVDVAANSSVREMYKNFLFSKLPSCVLLNNGEPIDENDQPIKISGDLSKKDFLDFLDDYAQPEIDELIEKKEEQAEQERIERIARLNAQARYYAWNPYGGYGPYFYESHRMYPHYYSYGYPRAHVGFGIVL